MGLNRASFPAGFVNQVLIRGVPILNSYPNKVFWVHSGTGASTNSGKTPSSPLATITQGLSKCTASKGDIIMCMPGHAESVIAAAGIAISKIGVAIVGMGTGALRPTITFATDTLADIDIDAANVSLINLRFVGNIAALAAPIDVNAAGFEMINCDFYCTTATTDFDITVITDAAADDMIISGCNFWYEYSLADTAVSNTSTECIRLVGADRAVIVGNFIAGNFTTAAINGITTLSTSIKINNNSFISLQTDKLWIDLVATCTGRIEYNVGTAKSTAGITDSAIIDAASCQLAQNFASDIAQETGKLIGTVSA